MRPDFLFFFSWTTDTGVSRRLRCSYYFDCDVNSIPRLIPAFALLNFELNLFSGLLEKTTQAAQQLVGLSDFSLKLRI